MHIHFPHPVLWPTKSTAYTPWTAPSKASGWPSSLRVQGLKVRHFSTLLLGFALAALLLLIVDQPRGASFSTNGGVALENRPSLTFAGRVDPSIPQTETVRFVEQDSSESGSF